MELLLILIYVSICYVIFKVFRIPVNQWSLATAALGGIIGISLLLLIMNYNHPFTKNARIYFAVTAVLPSVKGRVIEVPVKPNTPLKEGDELFRIDPKPYQYIVDQKKAALAEAEQNVKQWAPGPRRSARGSPTPRTSTASTPRSPGCAPSWPMPNMTSIRP
jgi:multidrug resistance efflux pump